MLRGFFFFKMMKPFALGPVVIGRWSGRTIGIGEGVGRSTDWHLFLELAQLLHSTFETRSKVSFSLLSYLFSSLLYSFFYFFFYLFLSFFVLLLFLSRFLFLLFSSCSPALSFLSPPQPHPCDEAIFMYS